MSRGCRPATLYQTSLFLPDIAFIFWSDRVSVPSPESIGGPGSLFPGNANAPRNPQTGLAVTEYGRADCMREAL
jgi:hypothetical protein